MDDIMYRSIFGFLGDFSTELQTFQHQLVYTNGKVVECRSCEGKLGGDETYSQFWKRKDKEELTNKSYIIDDKLHKRNITDYLLVNEGALQSTSSFLKESYEDSITTMLYWMFQKCAKLQYSLTYHVAIAEHCYLVHSPRITVEHFYDIDQSVSEAHDLLLKRLGLFMQSTYSSATKFTCGQIRLNVKKTPLIANEGERNLMALPRRIRLRAQGQNIRKPMSAAELKKYEDLYRKYQSVGVFPPTMGMDLYCIRRCVTEKEAFLAPYHIRRTRRNATNKKFIIVNDVLGNFHRLHEVTDLVVNPIEPPPAESSCKLCDEECGDPFGLLIHQKLDCGKNIGIESVDPNRVETYWGLESLAANQSKHKWYIIKTISHMTRSEVMERLDPACLEYIN